MAKRQTAKEQQVPEAVQSAFPEAAPEVWGFGLESVEGGFIACRVSSHGKVERMGPKRTDGTNRPESKPLALSRAFEAFQMTYAPPGKMRFR